MLILPMVESKRQACEREDTAAWERKVAGAVGTLTPLGLPRTGPV